MSPYVIVSLLLFFSPKHIAIPKEFHFKVICHTLTLTHTLRRNALNLKWINNSETKRKKRTNTSKSIWWKPKSIQITSFVYSQQHLVSQKGEREKYRFRLVKLAQMSNISKKETKWTHLHTTQYYGTCKYWTWNVQFFSVAWNVGSKIKWIQFEWKNNNIESILKLCDAN